MHCIVPPGDLLWCGLGELWQLQRRADEAQALGVEAREERATPVTEEGDGRHLRAHVVVGKGWGWGWGKRRALGGARLGGGLGLGSTGNDSEMPREAWGRV